MFQLASDRVVDIRGGVPSPWPSALGLQSPFLYEVNINNMIRGNLGVYKDDYKYKQLFAPKITHAKMLRPQPKHDVPTNEMNVGALAVNDAYRFSKGDTTLEAEMFDFDNTLDVELSNDAGIVFEDGRGRVVVALRGRDPDKASTAVDDANVMDIITGKAPRNVKAAVELVEGAISKYGSIQDLHGYSMSGGLITHMAREMPETFASIENVQLINPLLGPRDVAAMLPENVTIARTVEDFASGPGVSLALRKGTIKPNQIQTVRGIAGEGEHSLGHFVDSGEERGATEIERVLDAHNAAAMEHVEQPTPKTKANLALRQAELSSAV